MPKAEVRIIYNRMPRKSHVNVIGIQNSFAALASDSDSEKEEVVALKSVPEPTPVVAPVSPQFRVWNTDDDPRFKRDNNIFSSPFSRKRGTLRPRFKEDNEGWVSIQVGQPEESPPLESSGLEHAEEIPDISLPPQAFPSMLNRGDQETALIWAEKVKKSLEKAERLRGDFKRGKDTVYNTGAKLSFFRKLHTVEQ